MSVVLSDLTFSFPNGKLLFSRLNASFNPGRTGLIGANGSGKSTLLRLAARQLRPSSGAVTATGEIGYLPQDLTLDTGAPVAALLGIAGVRAAIRAVEAGSVDPAVFDAVGDAWDIDDRAREQLARLGLGHVGLDDPVGRLSGGEAVLAALSALLLRRPAALLLDEPTNNLDLDARRRLYAAVQAWPGVALVVSHDRALLALMDQVADLNDGALRLYGGNLDAYESMLATEQAAALRVVNAAGADVRRERRDLAENQVKQARRDRQGGMLAASGSLPHILAGARKRSAQVSAGKTRDVALERIASARSRLAEAGEALRDDAVIRVALPETAVPAGRTVLAVAGLDRPWAPWHAAGPGGTAGAGEDAGRLAELVVRGPERIALTGPNGAGKTTLLRALAGPGQRRGPDVDEVAGGTGTPLLPDGVTVRRNGPSGYLPQRLDILDEARTVLENVRAVAPGASLNEARAGLARFLFRGARADQQAGTLSGGERFRAVLAALLLADPPPQLLLLDEPTNNLDLASVRQLAQALSCYQGALIVVSHDMPFLESLGITRWLRLDRSGRLSDTGASPGSRG
jgi:ATPase subunit of ABC transporter with duplicated ATPase domains